MKHCLSTILKWVDCQSLAFEGIPESSVVSSLGRFIPLLLLLQLWRSPPSPPPLPLPPSSSSNADGWKRRLASLLLSSSFLDHSTLECERAAVTTSIPPSTPFFPLPPSRGGGGLIPLLGDRMGSYAVVGEGGKGGGSYLAIIVAYCGGGKEKGNGEIIESGVDLRWWRWRVRLKKGRGRKVR